MFCIGAMNHGFDCPAILGPVWITHTPVTDQPNSNTPTAITATITSDETTINEGALAVYYEIDGGSFQAVGMSNVGGDDYTGYIPGQVAGSQVEYYIYAEDDNGNSATDPSTAPLTLYKFFVGLGELTTAFSDDLESGAAGWTIGVAGDDATTGQWELGDPEGTSYNGQPLQPEDDHTPAPGVNCFATGLLAGSSAGTYDVDGGKTTVQSPVFDLTAYATVVVDYWRWYSNNLGNAPNSDTWLVQVNDGSGWVDLENTMSSDNSWGEHLFSVGSYVNLTSTVQFQFVASDEGSGSLVEAAMDDFVLLAALATSVDPDQSTITANTDLMLSPDGLGDSTMTIVVTARDAGGAPIAGIPAGDVVVAAVATSSLGQGMIFCSSGTNQETFVSTGATDANGQVTFTVSAFGGCGTVSLAATIQSVPLSAGAAPEVRGPDFTGDGVVNYFDTFQYLPMLSAATGYCGNLDGSGDGVVNFNDTVKYLLYLANHAQCP